MEQMESDSLNRNRHSSEELQDLLNQMKEENKALRKIVDYFERRSKNPDSANSNYGNGVLRQDPSDNS